MVSIGQREEHIEGRTIKDDRPIKLATRFYKRKVCI